MSRLYPAPPQARNHSSFIDIFPDTSAIYESIYTKLTLLSGISESRRSIAISQAMEQPDPGNYNLARPAIWAIAGVYFLTALMLFYLLSAVWPVEGASAVVIFNSSIGVSADVRLIWLVVITSALGSYIHTVTSFTLYAGNRSLFSSWMAWYVLRPAISAALALIFYFALRAGLFSGAAADQTINPFGIAAISGMVGMFSKQATEKLSKIFDTIFT